MAGTYRIFGSEASPYSVKVRSYMRYKGIPHEWVSRTVANMEEFGKYAKLPLIPCVVAPDETAMQDSTPIIETLEAQFPDPALNPADPAAAFLAVLIEEYADEWGNKHMFHHRWNKEVDQKNTARWLSELMVPDGDAEMRSGVEQMVLGRMPGRLWFVGSSPETAPIIEASFTRLLRILNDHLMNREYLFGGRPSMADLGIWAQLYEASCDPTARGIMLSGYPTVMEYVERGLFPEAIGEFEALDDLLPTLQPLLEDEIGGLFLPWSDANAKAIADGADEFTVQLGAGPWTQKPQKYHARSLAAIRAKYAAVADKAALDPILERIGCLKYLQGQVA